MAIVDPQLIQEIRERSKYLKNISEAVNVDEEGLFEELKTILLDLINKDNFKIPMISTVARELLSIIDEPNITFEKLSHLIEQDQFIGGKLLKVANSPFYASKYPVSKPDDAVRRLGLEETRKILFMISMSNIMLKKGMYAELFASFWQHSLAAAVTAKEIAKSIGIDSSYAYTAGLMHDIGRTFTIVGVMSMFHKGDSTGISEIMLRKISYDLHTKMGDLIAKKWNLPGMIHDSIIYHHNAVQAKTASDIALLTFCTEKLSNYLGYGDEKSVEDIKKEPAFYILGLDEEKIDLLIDKLSAELRKMSGAEI